MIKLNKNEYLDKLHACWLGKNIGGTLGAPYEGTRSFLDVKGFKTEYGEPLPNDDLDLQLVWLRALEDNGVKNFNTNILAEYWLERIAPHCNEYGNAKTNLSMGLLPPMSGEVDNDKWKTSNGAWIRSEVWSSLAPGVSDVAVKYAIMDAMVDHGIDEGTYAEMFTASLQSAAYFESDIMTLIEMALKKIPEDSMVSKTVRLVIDCYDKGVDYKETREKVVEFNKELGWFQAPNNLGFVIIGLLYGEGDFKKSMFYTINCGDDTDCTGGTVGSTLGIIGGTNAIPDDFKNFVGDKILTAFINGSYGWTVPKTCTDLTRRVAALVPDIMRENGVKFEFTDEETSVEKGYLENYNKTTASSIFTYSRYSYDICHYRALNVKVEIDKHPRVKSGETRKVKLTFKTKNNIYEPKKLQVKLFMPNDWTHGDYDRTVHLDYPQWIHEVWGVASTEFEVYITDKIEPINRIYAEITCSTMAYPIPVPITLIG